MSVRASARREKIASLVAARGEVSVEEISVLCGASVETIRRDLTALQDSGALLKVHGGAKRAPTFVEGSFQDRMSESLEGKKIIAQKLAEWITPDQLVMMDTGTTTLVAAQALVDQPSLSIVTNSLKIASVLAASPNGPEVTLLGGRVEGDNAETVGTTTQEQIQRLNADCAIITIFALSAEHGACDYSFEEAEVARAMVSQADRTIVLADAAKFDRKAAYKVLPVADIDVLITDRAPGGALAEALESGGAHVL